MDFDCRKREMILPGGRPVLVVRLSAAESEERARQIRDYVVESLALGVLVVDPGTNLHLEYYPPLGGVTCTLQEETEGEEPEGEEGTEQPDESGADQPVTEKRVDQPDAEHAAAHVGPGARVKKRILARLTSYRKTHGLGCLRQVAELAGKPLTEEILRMTLLGEVKQPLEVWKQIDRALDALEQEGGHE